MATTPRPPGSSTIASRVSGGGSAGFALVRLATAITPATVIAAVRHERGRRRGGARAGSTSSGLLRSMTISAIATLKQQENACAAPWLAAGHAGQTRLRRQCQGAGPSRDPLGDVAGGQADLS